MIGGLVALGIALILTAVGQGLLAALALWIGLIVLYVMVCRLIGRAAARKGRSELAFFCIALLISPILAAVIVASIAPVGGPVRAQQDGAELSGDAVQQIRRLGELRDAGLLTEEEFSAKKAELLDRL